MENLRSFLYQFSADEPVYFGCKFHPFVKQVNCYGNEVDRLISSLQKGPKVCISNIQSFHKYHIFVRQIKLCRTIINGS